MGNRISLFLVALLLCCSVAHAGISVGTGAGWSKISAIQKYNGAQWQNVTPSIYTGGQWYALISYGDNYDYHFFVVSGQSNSVGFCAGTYQTSQNGIEIKRDNRIIDPLTDPTGMDVLREATTGSWHPAFCDEYYAQTGKRVILLLAGVGGWHVDYWWQYGTCNLFETTVLDEVEEALAVLDAEGYKYIFKGMIWFCGEGDAMYLGTQTTKEEYKSNLNNLIDCYMLRWPTTTWYETKIGIKSNYAASCAIIREAQGEVIAARSDVKLSAENNRTNNNDWHYVQTTYNSIGVEIAQTISGE